MLCRCRKCVAAGVVKLILMLLLRACVASVEDVHSGGGCVVMWTRKCITGRDEKESGDVWRCDEDATVTEAGASFSLFLCNRVSIVSLVKDGSVALFSFSLPLSPLRLLYHKNRGKCRASFTV